MYVKQQTDEGVPDVWHHKSNTRFQRSADLFLYCLLHTCKMINKLLCCSSGKSAMA